MDDDAAELHELRRRAFGPDADIGADPASLARLVELEDRVRADVATLATSASIHDASPPPASTGAIGSASRPAGSEPSGREDPAAARLMTAPSVALPIVDGPAAQSGRSRPRWHTAMVAAVVAAAVVLAASAAIGEAGVAGETGVVAASDEDGSVPVIENEPVQVVGPLDDDPSSAVLIEVPIDNASEDYFDRPAAGVRPQFPVPDDLTWAAPLGSYFGRELWIARTRSGIPCVALVRDDDLKGKCEVLDRAAAAGVAVIVPYAEIALDERPTEMTPDQSIAYWWPPSGSVLIQIGVAPAADAG